MYKPIVLILATAFAAPALWLGLVDQTLPLQVTLTRYLIAVPVVAIALAMLRSVTRDYGKKPRDAQSSDHEPSHPMRRAVDNPPGMTTVDGEIVRDAPRGGSRGGRAADQLSSDNNPAVEGSSPAAHVERSRS